MSANPLFSSKKRDNSTLFGGGHLRSSTSFNAQQASDITNNDRSKCPPPKRYRTDTVPEIKTMADPFCDNEDFTADDLEEIDILASQAYTQDSEVTDCHTDHIQSRKLTNKQATNIGNKTTHQTCQQRPPSDPLESYEDKYIFEQKGLQTDYEDLKQKMKELQDQVVIKNGEIKVLRDALRQTESNFEQQKISQVLSEKEKAQIYSEKEKDLLKKMQSLKSELEFKDAEMNELKTKLLNCERNRIPVQSVSPKKSPSKVVKLETFSSPPGKNCFPTKESFTADMNLKPSTSTMAVKAPIVKSENDILLNNKKVKNLPYSYHTQRKNGQGSVLLNALMQQSLRHGSLGLYDLLSSNQNVVTGSPTCSSHSSRTPGTTSSSVVSPARCSALQDAQKLAITGLNSIAVGEDLAWKRDSQSLTGLLHLNKMSRLSGAVHILPLVEYHIAAYCHALETLEKSKTHPSDTQEKTSSSAQQNVISNAEDSLSSLVEPSLASLEILYHLVFYSLEVVEALLQNTAYRDETVVLLSDANTVDCSEYRPHPLLKKLTSLLSSPVVTCQKNIVQNKVLSVLVKLAENSPNELLYSFNSLFTVPTLRQCLSRDSPTSVAHMVVKLLAVLSDHQKLSALLCSCSEGCLFHALYSYVISRPDKTAPDSIWLQFEQEVVRFLTKRYVQGWNGPAAESSVTCHCNREVVKALVLMLHQEWLHVRRSVVLPPTAAHRKSVQFLQETVMLLHTLSQRDKNFSEHCLEVLHQYDQAVPGVRAVLKKFQVLREVEEFALDELCPPEIETEEEYMDCT
ncbi:ATR-interacting isoform X1 [Pelobates cultripes]|nr:ATR-interacting isoform X1 [Pelobates cultripes]